MRTAGKLRAELAALGQKAASLRRNAALEERRQAYLIFAFSRLVIFSSIVCIQPFAVLSFKK